MDQKPQAQAGWDKYSKWHLDFVCNLFWADFIDPMNFSGARTKFDEFHFGIRSS